jgi:hypothetical protein
MSNEARRLRAYVDALVMRERRLLTWGAALRGVTLLGVGALVAVLAVALGWDRARAVLVEVLAVGLGGLAWVAWPLARGWSAAGSSVAQAQRVEALEPSLAGWMVIPVDALDGLMPGESPESVGWVTVRAVAAAERHPPAEVHPAHSVLRWLGGAAASWLVALVSAAAIPGGSAAVLSWWLGGGEAAAAEAGAVAAAGLAPARVGDLTLRYVYPDYTGLAPYEVVNSTGEARAVPGTRVEVVARSASAVDRAALAAYDETLDASVTDGRSLSGAFTVRAEEGAWRVMTWEGGELRASRDFPIHPTADLPPEVVLQADAPTIEVPIDGWIDLPWLARDDFGVARVVLEVDGKESARPLKVASERQAEVSGDLRRRPVDLGMREGGTYTLVVAAWDNDEISGSKVGRSQAVRLVVLGEDGVSRVSQAERQALLDLLVDLLGDHLEEPFPPGRSGSEFAKWGEALHERYRPVADFVEGFRNRRGQLVQDFAPVGLALDAGRTLIRYTQVTFVPDGADDAHTDAVAAVTGFRDEAVVTVEEAVLQLDRLLRAAAYRQVQEAIAELRRRAEEVDAALGDPAETALALVEVEAYLETLGDVAAQLPEGGLQDLITTRSQEARSIAQEARSRLGEGKPDEGRRLAERASQRLKELASAIGDELERRKEEQGKQKGEAKKLMEALEDLARRQDELAAQVQALQEATGADRAARLMALWQQLREATGKVDAGLARYQEDLKRSGRLFNETELVGWAKSEAENASRAVEFQDLAGAAFAAVEMDRLWRQYASRFDQLARRGLAPGAPGVTEIGGVGRDMVKLLELLEVARRTDEGVDASTASSLRGMRSPELGLESELQGLKQDAARMAQEMPVRPRGMQQSLDKADERMVQAADELQAARALQAQGSQQAASQHIRDAIRSLSEAMAAAARAAAEERGEGGQGGQGGEEDGESEGGEGDEDGEADGGDQQADGDGGDRGADGMRQDDFDLPQPEEFRTPEAWRRALVEGMSGEVPEEYRALKARYYEELVHQ